MPLYSHSGLSSFESCPRQFWYRYIGKPEVEKADTIEAFLGKRVHETLEELYKLRLGGRALGEPEMLAWYEAAWAKAWSDDVRVLSPRFTADDFFADAEGAPAEGMPAVHMDYRFEPTADGTRMVCVSSYDSLDDLQKTLDMGMEEGLTGSMGQMEAVLAEG